MTDNTTEVQNANADFTPPPKRSRWKKITAACFIIPLLLLLMVMIMVQTERGTTWVCKAVDGLTAGHIKVDWRSGSLAHGGAASQVVIHLSSVYMNISNISGEWSWDYVPLKWNIKNLSAEEVNVTLIPTPDTGKPVGDILMPFAIVADRVQVATLNLIKNTTTTTMTHIDGAVSTDKRNHLIQLTQMTQGVANYSGMLKIDGVRPYALASNIQAISDFEGHRYRLNLTADGDLKHLNLGLNASGGVSEQPLNGQGILEIQLLERFYIHKGQVDFTHLNPYVFWSKLLKADLDISLVATPQAVEANNDEQRKPVDGTWKLVNHAAAPLSDFSLPVNQATGSFALTSDVQKLNDIEINVARNGRITGGGAWQADKGLFEFNVVGFDLKNVHPKLVETQLGGKLNIDATKTEQHFIGNFQNSGSNRMVLFADILVERSKVNIKQAQISGVGEAKIEMQGELAYTEGLPFKGKAQLSQFNLADLGDFPSSRLVGQFDVDGLSLPKAKVSIKGNLNDSIWAGVAAKGVVDVSFAPDTITARDLNITIGANHLDAKGVLGVTENSQNKLVVNVNAPNLAQLQFSFGGSLIGKADLTGSLTRPRGQVDATAKDLKIGNQSVIAAKINGVWESGAQGAMNGVLDIERYQNGMIKLESLKLDVKGTQASHQFNTHVVGNIVIKEGGAVKNVTPIQWILNADVNGVGHFTDEGWQGEVSRLTNDGQPKISLQKPFQIAWVKGELKLSNIVAQVQNAQLNLETLNVLGARINSRGHVNNLVVPQWLTWLNVALPANLSTDMTIKGQWDLTMGSSPSGGFTLEHENGDMWLDKRQKNALGISDLTLKGILNGRNMNIMGNMASARFGQVGLTGNITLVTSEVGWVISGLSPLDLSTQATFSKLDQFNSLLGTNVKLQGQMQADIRIGGVLGNPTMQGLLTGQNVEFLHVEQGFKLKDGIIKLKLADSSVDFEQFDFNGVEGKLFVRGQVTYGSGGKFLTAQVTMDKFKPFVRLDRQLTMSGQAELGYDGDKKLLIKGNVRSDKALIELFPILPPSLDNDVVVCSTDPNKSKRCEASAGLVKAERLGVIPSIDLTLELGENFRFKGQGADVKLVGSVRLESKEGSPLQAKGVVRVDNGSYKFYGQRLMVDRGIVTFQGPIDDPALNMFATRTVGTTEVGVELTGTLADSKARLISSPEMPDEEKLAYLLFGRSSSTLSSSDGSAVAGAAAILLGTDQGRKVTEKLGIDNFNFGNSDSGLTGTVVGVGRRLNDRFTIAYEQSINDVAGVVKITWILSRNWQVILRGGSINGMDIQYSKRFDKL